VCEVGEVLWLCELVVMMFCVCVFGKKGKAKWTARMGSETTQPCILPGSLDRVNPPNQPYNPLQSVFPPPSSSYLTIRKERRRAPLQLRDERGRDVPGPQLPVGRGHGGHRAQERGEGWGEEATESVDQCGELSWGEGGEEVVCPVWMGVGVGCCWGVWMGGVRGPRVGGWGVEYS
jgi:hypothetical protein